MLDNLLGIIHDEDLATQLFHSLMSFNVEERRVDRAGRLSREPHPEVLGAPALHPYFQTRYADMQVVVSTDSAATVAENLDDLATLQTVLYRSLDPADRIWPLSMPPRLSEDDRQQIMGDTHWSAEAAIKPYLMEKYGVTQGCLTAVHVNFRLPDPVIHRLYFHYTEEFHSLVAFKNALYFRLAQNYVRYQWLITYLFGASPIAEEGFFDTVPAPLRRPVRSILNSPYGRVNRAQERVTYASLASYLTHLQRNIDNGTFASTQEFYGPVRLRGQANERDFLMGGVRYLELRNFDNSPFAPDGVSQQGLRFLKIFLAYLLTKPLSNQGLTTTLTAAQERNQLVALEAPDRPTAFLAEGQALFLEMREMLDHLGNPVDGAVLDDLEQRLVRPELTPAAKLVAQMKDGSLMAFGADVANTWTLERRTTKPLLPRLTMLNDHTQRFVMAAIQAGVRFYEISDGSEGDLLMFTYDGITQILQDKEMRGRHPEQRLRELFPELPPLVVHQG
ncbi:gamma-glutamylcysteine synthetase [Levilactobacillus tangyuanensis]|uniref:Glutamate--cysteine ligase n=1 Tax=Levilactobacillus tangyuanensis TaxID=2486021 RepID=A0ABW1TL90_9LACO|nr:gamma-glutamylcysteine synthetase [Levilactobacillus tangyuanensis]